MTGYIIGAVVATLLLAAFLLRDSDPRSRRYSGGGFASVFSTMFEVTLAVVLFLMIWGGGVMELAGCVCILLKLLAVEPVVGWTWLQALLPLIGGVVVQCSGLLIASAIK